MDANDRAHRPRGTIVARNLLLGGKKAPHGASIEALARNSLATIDEDIAKPKVNHSLKPRKQRKGGGGNIFADYGASMMEGQKDGDLKSLNVRRYWKSDKDVTRWRQDLADNSRLDRLLMDVCFRSNPEFGTNQAELAQQHNALFRQRASMEKERKASEKGSDPVKELRKMVSQLIPKEKEKKKRKPQTDFGMLKSSLHKPACFNDGLSLPGFPYDQAEAISAPEHEANRSSEMFIEAEVEDDDIARDLACLSQPSSGSLQPSSGSLLEDAAVTSVGFFRHTQDSGNSLSKGPNTTSKFQLPKMQPEMKTISLLLYKNADPHHTGTPFFHPRVPNSLKELLSFCGETLTVFVPPADALYDVNLQQVKDLKELEGGGMFLLKGHEALSPPPAFALSLRPEGGSLKKLTTFQRATAVNAEQHNLVRKAGGSKSLPVLHGSTTDCSSNDDNSPSRLQQLQLEQNSACGSWRSRSSSVRHPETWGISDRLQWQLSYRGQVGKWSGKHTDYSTWRPMATTLNSGRSVDNQNGMRSTR